VCVCVCVCVCVTCCVLCVGAGSNAVSGDTEETLLKRLRSVLDDEDVVSGKCRGEGQ